VSPKKKPYLILFLLATATWSIPGCSVTDYIGAYFNTFYNARRQFVEAEDEVLSQPELKLKDKPFGYTFNPQPATKTKFAAVIEKCSKLLQYHPESNLVDDALMMIGKSYYYQNDYQAAERKFKELLTQFPSSDLAFEGKLTLSYVQYMMNNKIDAGTTAKELYDAAVKEDDDAYIAKSSLVLAQIEIDNKNSTPAKAYLFSAADKGGSATDRFNAYMNLASLYVQDSSYKEALDAYRKAEGESPNYQTDFKSRIGEARMLSRLGSFDESLDLLRRLLDNTNYREFFAEAAVEIGNVFKENKEYSSAIAQYTYVDTAYARTEHSANSYFQLGDLYETRLHQFDSALVAYTRGKTEFVQAPITLQSQRRAEYIGKYIQYRNEIHRLDSLREILLRPPDTTNISALAQPDSSRDTSTHSRDTTHLSNRPGQVKSDTDSILAKSDSTRVLETSKIMASDSIRSKSDTVRSKPPSTPPGITLDSANTRLASVMTELAALFYNSMDRPDSAEKWFDRLLTDYPASPHVPRALFTLAQINRLDTTRSRSRTDSLYNEITERFPGSEFAIEAERLLGRPVRMVVIDPAEASYARAATLMDDGKTKPASDTLRAIVGTYPSSPVAAKAQYALGWMFESVDQRPDSAVSNYKRLMALYPTSKYVSLIRPKVEEYDLQIRALEQQRKDSLAAITRDSLAAFVRDSLARVKPEVKEDPKPPAKIDEEEIGKRPKPPAVGSTPDSIATPPKPLEVPDESGGNPTEGKRELPVAPPDSTASPPPPY
jgi:outer membrane protein assembly factor BamD (BamD/ComL family)